MTVITLQLQPDAAAADRLAAFLITPDRQLAFPVAQPAWLEQSYGAWRSRFLAHHSTTSGARPPADVVRHYGGQLSQAFSRWLQQDDWQPLLLALERHPAVPLLIRAQDSRLEALPWEVLPWGRPIWRQPPAQANGQLAAAAVVHPPMRRPRVLLVVGVEADLQLDSEIQQLQHLQRQSRISLTVLRRAGCSLPALQQQLLDPAGWDVLAFLGHSDRDGSTGGRLQLGDGSWLPAAAFQAELIQAAQRGLQLVLLSSCNGTDLASTSAAAGIPWTVCFREPVPDQAASTTFTALLAHLQDGDSLAVAIRQVRRQLEQHGPVGSHLLLSAYTPGPAPPLRLPLQRQQLVRRRLARSTRPQLLAAASCTLLAGFSALVPWNPLSTYLLDRRLDLQRQWRELTAQPGPGAPSLPVLLIDPQSVEADYGALPTPGRVPRRALAEILARTPVAAVPKVGLDVVLDEPAPHSEELAAVLQRQQRPMVIAGWFSADSAAPNPGDRTSRLPPVLQASPLQTRRLDVNTPGRSNRQRLQPLPLRLQEPISSEHFSATLADHPAPFLPADAVIDWSLDWSRLIRRLEPAELATLQAPSLLVGSSGVFDPAHPDLFEAPGAAARTLARVSGGSTRQVPGVLVQAALAQSITLQHWLRPLPMLPITALAGGVGVLLAAAVIDPRRRLLLVGLIAAAAIPLALQLAVSHLLLLPLALPLTALACCAALRNH